MEKGLSALFHRTMAVRFSELLREEIQNAPILNPVKGNLEMGKLKYVKYLCLVDYATSDSRKGGRSRKAGLPRI